MRTAWITASFLVLCSTAISAGAARQRLRMDLGWRFHLGEMSDVADHEFDYPEVKSIAKAAADDAATEAAFRQKDPALANLGANVSALHADFDDSSWRAVDLPHDWAVELPFDQTTDKRHGFKALGGKNNENTIGWYRRAFDLSADDANQSLSIEFDGVYRNCLVWLNGHCLGRNASGYSSFAYDITKYANIGGRNELVVRVDATREEGWFYEGAGIYRHVWLLKTSPVHVAHWGTYVTCDVSGDDAAVTARTQVRNDSAAAADCTVQSDIIDPDGKTVATVTSPSPSIDAGHEQETSQQAKITGAKLWSLESPNLYTLLTKIKSGGRIVDTYETTFGIRTIRFDADKGFFLNGKHVPVNGMCNHQDHAGVGAALPDRLQYFRIEKLKEFGCNAYRTSHNPPTPELLDACDRLGMLVMDENRRFGDYPVVMDELQRLVERDRNHPSVVIWSICNEEPLKQRSEGERIAKPMVDLVHKLDPTRPVTAAINSKHGNGISKVIDVEGVNYFRLATDKVNKEDNLDSYHATHPNQPVIGTEEASTRTTRGEYFVDKERGYLTAYDSNGIERAAQWVQYYAERPWLAGGFVWTGFDYRGEPTPYSWPCISSHFGILDTCGFPKDLFWYYQECWMDKPVLHLLPHWNWAGKEGQPIDVWCYTNYPSVELFLNGKQVGERRDVKPRDHAEWKVKYEPGVLEVRAYRGTELVATDKVETTGAPAKLVLTPDRVEINADGEDVSIVNVAVVDSQGRVVPTASNLVKFDIAGNAKLIGVGNGDPSCHESDKASQRSAFNGLCMAIVQTTTTAGEIQTTATADGLTPATATLHAKSVESRPSVAVVTRQISR
jgi:beta-galactosidase